MTSLSLTVVQSPVYLSNNHGHYTERLSANSFHQSLGYHGQSGVDPSLLHREHYHPQETKHEYEDPSVNMPQ